MEELSTDFTDRTDQNQEAQIGIDILISILYWLFSVLSV